MLYIKSKEIQLHLKPREMIPMVILGLTEMQETGKKTMTSLLQLCHFESLCKLAELVPQFPRWMSQNISPHLHAMEDVALSMKIIS